jgi:hypothetical protein
MTSPHPGGGLTSTEARLQTLYGEAASGWRVYRILTIDNDDFGPLRVGPRFKQRLEIVP